MKQLQLVTPEQAALLKELGFDWETERYYDGECLDDDADKVPFNWNMVTTSPSVVSKFLYDDINQDVSKIASAPTVALALKYVREEKNIKYSFDVYNNCCAYTVIIDNGVDEDDSYIFGVCDNSDEGEIELMDGILVYLSMIKFLDDGAETEMRDYELAWDIVADVRHFSSYKIMYDRLFILKNEISDFFRRNCTCILKKMLKIDKIFYVDKIPNKNCKIVPNKKITYALGWRTIGESLVNIEKHNSEQQEKNRAELERKEKLLETINQKLSNEKFLAKAKADIIEKERQKKIDTEKIIKTLKETL
jgi:hypothetical protein